MEHSLLESLRANVARLSHEPDQALGELRGLYSEGLRYENPVQRIQGREGFLRLMSHMATKWAPFSMNIDEGLESADRVFGRFHLSFRPSFLGRVLKLEGVTRCVVENGLIVEQRDYYDAVSSALDAVPLAGAAFRKIAAQFTVT